jgi:hypothetical protein
MYHYEDTNDCMDAEGRQKTAPAFSAFTTSLWLSNAGAVAENTKFYLSFVFFVSPRGAYFWLRGELIVLH